MRNAQEENEDELDDSEDPDSDDADWNMDPATVACPYCGGEVSEDSERCPRCDRYISKEDAPTKKSMWIFVGIAFLVLLVVVGWLWRG